MRKKRVAAWIAGILAFLLLWFFSTGLAVRILAEGLDNCESTDIGNLRRADAVVILGGGMCYNFSAQQPEMSASADRVWHGARIYKAGKAGKIILTGSGALLSSGPLLSDFGVPASAITAFDEPRNTEEEARKIGESLGDGATIILVTSAWHMHRALLLFRRAGLNPIPSAADREFSLRRGLPLELRDFLPSADSLLRCTMAVKEHIAILGYRLLRR